MKYVIADLNDNSITINDVPYTKVYDFKIGTDTTKVTLKNVYDSQDVVFRNVNVSDIEIDGIVYETALEVMDAFEPLKKKVAEGEIPNLQAVLDAGNNASTDIELGSYQQVGRFISFISGLFGIFSRTTISPNSIIFEDNTSKITLLRESGFEPEVALYLPYKNGTLATLDDIVRSQYIRGFYPALTDGSLNTWQTWALNTSDMLSSNFNNSLGTGAVPAWADYNFITITNATKLSQLIFSSNQSYIEKNYEIIVESFDLVHGVGDLNTLTNKQTLIHETLSTSSSGTLTLKTNFTIANHTLSAGTAIRMAWRYIGGGPGYQLLGNQFIWKFD